jgi:hypothetical protein
MAADGEAVDARARSVAGAEFSVDGGEQFVIGLEHSGRDACRAGYTGRGKDTRNLSNLPSGLG